MTDLPDSWIIRPLGEIAQIVRGVTYKKADSLQKARSGFIPILRATNIGRSLDLDGSMVYVPRSGVTQNQLLRIGDIVLAASSGSLSVVGKNARLGSDWLGSFGAFCSVVRPQDADSRYVSLFLSSEKVRRNWSALAKGTNINNLKGSDMRSTPVPLPSLREQRRTVEILEDHLSHLDAAQLKIAAVDLRTHSMITALIRDELLRAGGRVHTLDDLAAGVKNGIYVSRASTTPDGVPILRIGAVRPLQLMLDDLRYSGMSDSELRLKGGLLEKGDLLFTRYNGNPAYVGACATVPSHALPLTYPDKLIRLRVRSHFVTPEFLAIACSYGSAREQISARVKTSAGQAGISGRDLKQVAVHIPSLEVQERVAQTVRNTRDQVSIIGATLNDTQRRSNALRKAVLAAAFTGKLTGLHTDQEIIEELAQ